MMYNICCQYYDFDTRDCKHPDAKVLKLPSHRCILTIDLYAKCELQLEYPDPRDEENNVDR